MHRILSQLKTFIFLLASFIGNVLYTSNGAWALFSWYLGEKTEPASCKSWVWLWGSIQRRKGREGKGHTLVRSTFSAMGVKEHSKDKKDGIAT